MRYLFLIGVMVWVFTQVIFDYCLIESKTNETIFYYAGMYLSYILMIINEILRSRDKYLTMVYGSIVAYLVYDIGFSLTLINKSYEYYEETFVLMPSYEFVIYLSVAMILIHTIFTKWAKY